jgi:hypothetical protein
MATNKTNKIDDENNLVTPTIRTDKIIELLADAKIDNSELRKNESITLLSQEVDFVTVKIHTSGIILWIILWYKLDLFKEIENNNILLLLFLGFIINLIIQIFNTSLYSSSATHELSSLINIEQMGAVTLGTISMFSIFSLSGYPKWSRLELIISLFLTALAIGVFEIYFFSSKKTGQQYSKLRKMKEILFNLMVMIFLLGLFFIHKSVTSNNNK